MDLKNAPEEIQIILDSTADGLFTVNKQFKITFFNKAAEKITKVPRQDAIGKSCCEVFKANICEKECALRKSIETKKPVINKNICIITPDGEKKPISISAAILKNKKGQFIGGVETFRDLSEIEELKKKLLNTYTVHDIVSKNKKIRDLFNILPEIAASNSNVLIEGPNGSGKELFARAIHDMSKQKDGTFVPVNLSALPNELIESELFGYKKGAFTGANNDKPGRMALANNGTLFLDEIGETSPAFQVKMLRIIQEKTYDPLGSTKSEKSNVRFLFATNNNLEEMVKKGDFREDFYYRINVIKISLPPLKERLEDIPLLVEHFISHYNKTNNKNISGIDNDVLNILMRHEYPGNIRELQNIIEHAFILCKGSIIKINHLPSNLSKRKNNITPAKIITLEDMEKKMIIESLQKNNHKKAITAQELGIDYTTLWRKMKKYGLKNSLE